jgi:hypothetical protein
MSREELSKALDQAEEIHAPKPPNGRDPDRAAQLRKQQQRNSLAQEVARLALVRLRDDVAYPIELRDVVERTGYTKQEIGRLVKPIFEDLAARDAAELGDSARPGQRDEVEAIGQVCKLFCDADGVAYATVTRNGHDETWPVSSRRFRQYVLSEYRRRYGRLAAGIAIAEGIDGIAATASEGPVCEVFVRLAGAGDKIYLDLCRDDWKVVEIDAGGWRILEASPVRFIRPTGLRPLPLPRREENGIARLRPLVNIPDEQEWKLYVLWLVASLRPEGPYPFLIPTGEQGSAKSWKSKVARRLVDPAAVLLARPPKSREDLMIAAKSAWVVGFDNVSSLDEQLADDLCSLATGAGLQKRKLHTDTDQVLIDACRPIVLNGIPDLASRGDFADRSIVLSGTEISDDARREEADLEQEFVAAAPAILGALLDGVAAGLKGRGAASAAIKQKPRMADFAVFAAAAASAFGWTADEFLEAYAQNRQTRVERVVEADPVAEAIHRLVLEADPDKERAAARPEGKKWSDYWEGTASELLKELEAAVSDGVRRQKRWPKGPPALSNRLTRAATGLRRLGIAVEKQKSGDRKIKLGKTAPTASKLL